MTKHTGILFLLTLLFFSCVDDEKLIPAVTPEAGENQDKNVVLTMQIPGTYLPVTYAYSENDENEIRTVDVLAFRVDLSGNEYYYRHIRVPAIMQGDGNTKKIQFRLEPVDVRLIVLANVTHLFTKEIENRLYEDSIAGNVTKEKMMKRFVFDMSEPFGKNREPFPMYGESAILRSADDAVGDIKMIRAVTRIDIVNSLPDSRATIDSVFLVHTRNKGFVSPGFDAKGNIVGTPNVPADAAPNTRIFGYEFRQNTGTASPAMEREIYIAEDRQDSDTPTAIILKITPGDRPAQFYRVDMLGKDGELLPVLRNYRYRLNIVRIMSDGYSTVEEAAAVPAPSLSSTVETNELGISAVVFNSQYKLGVSTTNIAFNADGTWAGQQPGETFYSLKVHTTWSGWSASWEEGGQGQWLNFTDVSPAGNVMDFPASRLELNMKATPNTTGQTRSGKIKLTAGTLWLEVNVTQHSGIN